VDEVRPLGIVALLLVVLTSTAHAECAWVLWNASEHQIESGTSGRGHRYETWERLDAYERKRECRDGLERRLAFAKDFPFFRVVGDEVWRFEAGTKPLRESAYTCWPDTIDPRGAKGSK
jgi:hypothetical protein